jgi:ATP-dependent Clp protease ATP-binding subunit ClpB
MLKEFKDEFISPEHLLLALLQVNDDTAKTLKAAGLTEKGLITAIKDLRKGDTIQSQTQETQFNTLNKYAKNLNELARQGKLDPVIGRDEEIRRTLHILTRRTKNNPILVVNRALVKPPSWKAWPCVSSMAMYRITFGRKPFLHWIWGN